MRPLPRAQRPPTTADLNTKVEWCITMIGRIVDASQAEPLAIADPFQVDNLATPTRALDAGAGALADVRAVLATLLADMKKRGMHRGSG